jgi:hypothetical protein
MTFHRFAIGQTVAANGFGIPPGAYRIVRPLPPAEGVPQYRAKSMVDGHESALAVAWRWSLPFNLQNGT